MQTSQPLLEFLRGLNDKELTSLTTETYRKDSKKNEAINLIVSTFFEAQDAPFEVLILLLQSALLAVTTARLIQKNTARVSNCWN